MKTQGWNDNQGMFC